MTGMFHKYCNDTILSFWVSNGGTVKSTTTSNSNDSTVFCFLPGWLSSWESDRPVNINLNDISDLADFAFRNGNGASTTEPLLDSWINDAVDHSKLQPNTKYLPPIHKIRRRVRTLQLLNKTMPDRPPVAGSTKINLSHIGASKVSTSSSSSSSSSSKKKKKKKNSGKRKRVQEDVEDESEDNKEEKEKEEEMKEPKKKKKKKSKTSTKSSKSTKSTKTMVVLKWTNAHDRLMKVFKKADDSNNISKIQQIVAMSGRTEVQCRARVAFLNGKK